MSCKNTKRSSAKLLLSKLNHLEMDHSSHVSQVAVSVSREMNLCHQQTENICMAALLHDCGKIYVPKSILNKSSPLSLEEFELIKTHPWKGYLLVKQLDYNNSICNGIHFHHERYDGGGYPYGLKGNSIPIEGRIIALLDAYSAMVLNRPYRKAMSHQDAVAEICNHAGTQFDPKLVSCFLNCV